MDLTKFKSIVIPTGAGISAESGVATFRDSNGLWENHRVEDVATPEAFLRDPKLVWKFYSMRRLKAAEVKPNLAHSALVSFAKANPGKVHLITQNVDVLHERADKDDHLPPLCMHGSLNRSRCTHCGITYFDDHAYFDESGKTIFQATGLCTSEQKSSPKYLHHYPVTSKESIPLSPCCQTFLRPHIVWFGEIPLYMEKIEGLLKEADLFVSIGTSGQVYPAAGFLQVAKMNGATTICQNLEEIPSGRYIDHFLQGKASVETAKLFKV